MLNQRLLNLIAERNWNGMTEVQQKSLDPILQGKNTLLIAPTGLGKTEAALIPVLNEMLKYDVKPVSLIYITPLKALINDLTIRINWWASRLGFYVSRKHGEVPQKEKNMRLKLVPHIVVTTPEGLEIDLDWASRFRENYKNVKWIIVDEIHELVNSKRGTQLSILLERLKEFSGYDFQRIGLSATVNDEDLMSSFLFGSSSRESQIIRVGEKKEFDLGITKVQGKDDIWKDASKLIVNSIEKPSLIFANSRFITERLHEELEKFGDDFYVHHSSISRESKNAVEDNLRNSKARAVICTKTLELGIDVGEIKKVIMFRPPPSVSSFLQRLGRSGHKINGRPVGEIICLYDFDILEALAIKRLAHKGKLEKTKVCRGLDIVARESIGIVLQYGELEKERIYKIITSSYPFRGLKEDKFEELILYMAKTGVLSLNGNKVSLGKFFFKLWSFNKKNGYSWSRSFSEFFSTISNDETFSLRWGDKTIGEIDAIYVYKQIRSGDILRVGGRLWRVLKINTSRNSLDVAPAENCEGEIPIWRGDSISKSYLLPIEISKILRGNQKNPLIKRIKQTYDNINVNLPSLRTIIVERREDEIVYSVLINERISGTLAHMLLYLAAAENSLNIHARYSIYGFSISRIDEKNLLEEILKINDKKLRGLIIKSILRSPLFFSTLKEIQISFGKVGKIKPDEDKFVVREALRQTVLRYFSIKGTMRFLKDLKEGKIKIVESNKPTPLGYAVMLQAPIKPWIGGLQTVIYDTLKGGAYTANELSEMTGISPKTLEARLKQMRKPDSKYRITNFIDVDSKEIRWCVAEEMEKIAKSCDFYSSFTPVNENETFIATIKPYNGSVSTELIFKAKEIFESPDEIKRRIPFEEIGELRVGDPVDPFVYTFSPRFYYMNKGIAPYVLLNAVAYIQSMKYS
ncbi:MULTISPECIES: DEAD/DEAH box helicase [Acidianus]|nr:MULTISPECIES: DEAD/DEAH box helicase [Acidianus]